MDVAPDVRRFNGPSPKRFIDASYFPASLEYTVGGYTNFVTNECKPLAFTFMSHSSDTVHEVP